MCYFTSSRFEVSRFTLTHRYNLCARSQVLVGRGDDSAVKGVELQGWRPVTAAGSGLPGGDAARGCPPQSRCGGDVGLAGCWGVAGSPWRMCGSAVQGVPVRGGRLCVLPPSGRGWLLRPGVWWLVFYDAATARIGSSAGCIGPVGAFENPHACSSRQSSPWRRPSTKLVVPGVGADSGGRSRPGRSG